MKTQESHPEPEDLIAFVENSGLQDQDIKEHAESCSQCQEFCQQISEIKAALPSLPLARVANGAMGVSPVKLDDPEHEKRQQLIERFVQANNEEKAKLTNEIKADSTTLKQSLHLLSHQSAMNRALESSQGSEGANNVVHLTREKKSPLINLSLAASVVILVALLAIFAPKANLTSPQVIVAQVESEGQLFWQTKTDSEHAFQGPGIGFFHEAQEEIVEQKREPYQPIKINFSEPNNLSVSWMAINDAALYRYSLFQEDSDGNREILIFSEESTTNGLAFSLDHISFEKAYVWRLEGQTKTGESFYTKGRFVLSAQE